MLHAIIMAGGSGTRFWPASRALRPKQLLTLHGDRTMIQSTIDRLGDLVAAEQQMVITNKVLVSAIADQLPDLPKENIIGEPFRRDTAPCIGLAAALVQHQDPDAVMAVMPSDHVITSPERFQAALKVGEKLVQESPTRIVTFGIPPTYPAESFGYIERGDRIENADAAVYQVKQFREKPNQETAQAYLDAATFYWNGGIFLWKATTILDALQQNAPAIYSHIETIAKHIGQSDYPQVLEREFAAIEGKSIDYAVMETYPNVVVVEADFSWDDVGSWQALSRLHKPDQDGNTVVGSHLAIDSKGCIIHSQADHTIVTIDLEDMIVVQTPDATLVAPKHAEERVREVVKAIAERGLNGLL